MNPKLNNRGRGDGSGIHLTRFSERKVSVNDAPVSSPEAAGAAGGSRGMGFIKGAIDSALALVKSPSGYMTANKEAPATINEIMVNYVAVLAAIPFLATLLGDLWYYSAYAPLGFVGSFVAYAFVSAVLAYILNVVAVYVIAMVIGALAPTFGSVPDQVKAMKLAAFVFTPVFLIGILDIVPLLGVLSILGVLYGLYILYLGLPILLGTPADKTVTYLVAVLVVTVVVYLIMGEIVGLVSAAVFHAGGGIL